MKESGTKEAVVDFTQLASGGNAKESPQVHSQEITHVKMASGEWVEIVKGSFNLYKTNKGVPFVEFKVDKDITCMFEDGSGNFVKTVQVFPATIAGWAFDE